MDSVLGVSIKFWRGQGLNGQGFVCVGLVHGHWFFWVVRFVRLRVYHSGTVVPRDVGSVGVGLVHGHWFFWLVWCVRLRVYHSGIVVLRDVGSAGVGLGCVVRVQRPSDATCGLKRGCGPEPRGGNPPARSRCKGFPFGQSLMKCPGWRRR
jgi:hypothetical protein